jgi:hypothetical protein
MATLAIVASTNAMRCVALLCMAKSSPGSCRHKATASPILQRTSLGGRSMNSINLARLCVINTLRPIGIGSERRQSLIARSARLTPGPLGSGGHDIDFTDLRGPYGPRIAKPLPGHHMKQFRLHMKQFRLID